MGQEWGFSGMRFNSSLRRPPHWFDHDQGTYTSLVMDERLAVQIEFGSIGQRQLKGRSGSCHFSSMESSLKDLLSTALLSRPR